MKEFLVLLVVLFPLLAIASSSAQSPELKVVPSVDLKRYTGKWYEIARLPNRFQKDCAAAVTATYTLLPDGKIGVLNQCLDASGKEKSAKGKAKVADKATNAKLRVTFFWPFYGDYWILDLGPDYEYAVVGEPKRRYCWILSRTQQMEESLYTELLARIAKQGYDTHGFIRTPAQPGR
ncbi:MAG TPA: lipocalin family protein [Acidobacteriota bacterium]|nr:lipocalin family protein [Acidobacteriota bacterium]